MFTLASKAYVFCVLNAKLFNSGVDQSFQTFSSFFTDSTSTHSRRKDIPDYYYNPDVDDAGSGGENIFVFKYCIALAMRSAHKNLVCPESVFGFCQAK
jgi:hypothetical protein